MFLGIFGFRKFKVMQFKKIPLTKIPKVWQPWQNIVHVLAVTNGNLSVKGVIVQT